MVPGIAQGGGNLGGLDGELRGQPLPQPDHFQKIPAVVGPQVVCPDLDSVNSIAGIRRADDPADAWLAMRGDDGNCFGRRCSLVLG